MRKTLSEISNFLGGRVVGDRDIVITGVSGLKEAGPGDLTFLANPKYLPLLKTTKASAVIVAEDVSAEGPALIRVANPSLAFTRVVALIKESLTPRIRGVHPTAVISPDAVLAENVGVGPHVVIEPGVRIGRGTMIGAGSYVGEKAVVGEETLIYPNVTLREDVSVGSRVIIHSGSVIGCDGFGYLTVEEKHMKIPQMGTVVIEDDVEIGACVTIDRARFDRTVIGKGTKVDNLVQIAHNVRTGENCIIVSQVGIAGSTTLGKNVILAGQVGVAGHLHVGDGAVVMAQSGISKDVAAKAVMFGSPADEHRQAARTLGHVGRLSHYVERIKALEEKIASLEESLKKRMDT
ncbi:MAG: UDP-3-O-(3-hydroxymyristoyl)glucosamine N-acyltransferase [Elusimicrobia bacterium]|nr:UDP-3-O-(3-hydroxymyristoyl)glucosamine N-acyltransferase [Elusimicrobiota bacterium]